MVDNISEIEKSATNSAPKEFKNYDEQFKHEMKSLIEQIDLSDLQRQFMKSRWMSQMLWLESRARQNRNRYYFLRLITIIGGVIVPALVSLNINGNNVKETIGWVAFALSQAVAISAAVEEFFHYGERQFFQLSGPYINAQSHSAIYSEFAQRVESIMKKDVEGYVGEVVQEKNSN